MAVELFHVVAISGEHIRTSPYSKIVGRDIAVVAFYPGVQEVDKDGSFITSVEAVLQDKDFKRIYGRLIYRSFFLLNIRIKPTKWVTEDLAKFKTEVTLRGY